MSPGTSSPPSNGGIVPWLLLAITLAYSLLARVGNPPFSPDSWTYFELSQTIGNDFNRVSTWRSFWSNEPYSAGFPPLWPALIWVANGIANLGSYSGFFLNFLIYIAFAAVAEAIGRRSYGIVGLGPLSALMLLVFRPFVYEIIAARSIPLALLLIAAQLYVLVVGRGWRWRAPLLGLLAGLAVMNRFDFLPAALGVVILAGLAERRWRAAVEAAVMIGIIILPWVIYSILTFGTPFATDSTLIALSVESSELVRDTFIAPPVTLFDDPFAWIAKVAWNLVRISWSVLDAMSEAVLVYPLILAVGVLSFRAWREHSDVFAPLFGPGSWTDSPVRLIVAFGATLAFPFLGYLAAGYADQRYFSPQIWLLEFFCLLVLAEYLKAWRHFRLAAATVLGVVWLTANIQIVRMGHAGPPRLAAEHTEAVQFQSTLACLEVAGAQDRDALMFIGNDTLAAKFGALADRPSAMLPRYWQLLGAGDVAIFLDRFQVRFAYLVDEKNTARLDNVARLLPIPGCTAPVVRIEALKIQSSTSGHHLRIARKTLPRA